MSELPPPVETATFVAVPTRRRPRPGELTLAWRIVLIVTWVGVFLAYLGVWKASEEIGIGTWWLGPRSTPQPIRVRILPFAVTAVFGILASYNVRRMPWISLLGAVVLAGFAVPDLSRSTGLAVVEFVIAGAVAVVSLASLTGTYRAAPAMPAPVLTPDAAMGPATAGHDGG